MGKSPSFQWYPKDILSDLLYKAMPWHVKGMYRELLDHSWLEDGLPNNQMLLKGLCGNPEDWPDIWAFIGQRFQLTDEDEEPYGDGRLHNHRLERERAKQKSWRAKSSAGGKKSAQVRKAKGKKPPRDDQPPKPNSDPSILKGQVVTLWHALVPSLGKIQGAAGAREVSLKARIKEHPDRKFWEKYFGKIETSNFLSHKNGGGWHKRNDTARPGCDFDWVMNAANMNKILEGKYDNGSDADQMEVEFTGAGEPAR